MKQYDKVRKLIIKLKLHNHVYCYIFTSIKREQNLLAEN